MPMNKAIDLYLTKLRDKHTDREGFQQNAHMISNLMAQQTLLHIKTKDVEIETPVTPTDGLERVQEVVLVPILRAGITMLPAFLHYFPGSDIAIVGLKRDEKTAIAHRYYDNFPPLNKNQQIIILDPMIATGGTGLATLNLLQEKGIEQKQILFISIVSAPEGIAAIKSKFPDITIITAATDEKLNDKKFIVPGLGDFGDRYFGTLD